MYRDYVQLLGTVACAVFCGTYTYWRGDGTIGGAMYIQLVFPGVFCLPTRGTCAGFFTSSFPIEREAKLVPNFFPALSRERWSKQKNHEGCVRLNWLNTSPNRTMTHRSATWVERCVKTLTNRLCCCFPQWCSSQFSHWERNGSISLPTAVSRLVSCAFKPPKIFLILLGYAQSRSICTN